MEGEFGREQPMNRDYKQIGKNIAETGFFSEYLPPCFYLNKALLNKPPQISELDLIPPLTFTMSRYSSSQGRRTVAIPEIGAYLVLQNYFNDMGILQEIIEFTESETCSFSQILGENGTIIRHEQAYDKSNIPTLETTVGYIDVVSQKIVRGAGAKAILKLDISNCFPSFYVHMIPAILLGAEKAQEEFLNSTNGTTTQCSGEYLRYSKLDKIVRRLNLNRTNGLLVGPLYSKIIAEGLLTQIDVELKREKMVFSRYVDDYEVYLYDNDFDFVLNQFTQTLRKYGFALNTEKIELVKFPYYTSVNLAEIFSEQLSKITKNSKSAGENEFFARDEDIIGLFNTFFVLEEQGTKGAVRYLLKSLESIFDSDDFLSYQFNSELYNAHLLSILQNEPRSLIKVCSLLLSDKIGASMSKAMETRLFHIASDNLVKNNDLEALWVIYLLLEKGYFLENTEETGALVSNVVSSKNELAQLLLLSKKILSIEQIECISKTAGSWLLLYELYTRDKIEENVFHDRLQLSKSTGFYAKLKKSRISFLK